MRLPFLQMESDLLAHGASGLAALLGCSDAQALGHVAFLRAWAVSRASDDAPPDGWVPGGNCIRLVAAGARWSGDPGVLVGALADPGVGLLEVHADGIRVLGMEPYADAWERNVKARERLRKHRERHAYETRTSQDVSGQTQTQTQKTEDLFPAVAPAPQRPKAARKPKASPDKPTDPRHAPLVADLTAIGFPVDGGKDAAHVKALLGLADQQPATAGPGAPGEVLRRARIAWGQFPDFNSARTLGDLRAHWGRFTEARGPPGQRPLPISQATVGGHDDSPRQCDGCGGNGSGAGVGEPQVWLGYECGCLGDFQAVQENGLHFTKAQEWARKRRAA